MAMDKKAWYDKAFISVTQKSGSDIQIRAKTTNLRISGGNYDIEGLETFGGKVKRVGTREDFEIRLDGIPVSQQDFDWIFHGGNSTASSITSSTVKDYRLAFLWTDQTGITSANQAITTSSEGYREMYVGLNCVSLEKEMDAGEHLKASMVFKGTFEDSTGSVNFKEENCDTTSALTTTGAYTTTNKF